MPNLTGYQAIFFDVDNTLSNSQKEITSATQSALFDLQRTPSHLQTAVCTGRIFAGLAQYAFQYFPVDAIHVISGGAQVIRTNGEVLWEQLISEEVSAKLCQKLLAIGSDFFISQEQKMYVTPGWYDYLNQGSVPIQLGNVLELSNWATPLISIRQVTEPVRQIVAGFPDFTVKEMANRHGSTYFDLTPVGVTKATGLQHWSEITQIPLTNAIGVGDSSNDIEFLQAIGWSVAMGNATPEIKAIADRVIGDSDADGLAVYLRQISEGAEI